MKRSFFLLGLTLVSTLISQISFAQNWLITGNSGTNPPTNFLGTVDSKALIFKTNNKERMRVDKNGQVGIGTTSPQEQLSIDKSLNLDQANANDGAINNGLSGGTGLTFGSSSGEGIASKRTTGGNQNGLDFYTSFINRMAISSAGNIGIGTIAPSFKLDVNGSVNAASVYLNGGRFLYGPMDGTGNYAVGFNALYSNTIGLNNAANGYQALYYNTTGSYNNADGYQALYSNTTASGNNANGYQALFSNTTANGNNANGYQALYSNTTGSGNSANGSIALYSNTTGGDNTATGAGSLSSNTTGSWNTANGFNALALNTTGTSNTTNGIQSLFYNTTGSNNTANGYSALEYNTAGFDNTSTGFDALLSNASGNNNTAEGFGADVNNGNYSNGSAFGNSALITANNQVRIGNSNVTSIGGYASWSNISDGRVKKNIKQNVPGLAFINKLQPITYNLDLDAADKIVQRPEMKDMDGKVIQPSQEEISAREAKEQIVYTGFVAQDVEKAAKEVGYDFSGVDAAKNDKDLYGLRYSEFVVPLVKAVQELSQKNDHLQKQVDELKATIASDQILSNNGFAELKILNSQLENILGQNIPNPFNNSTIIPFRIPKDCHDASIMITNNSSAEVVGVIPVSCNEDHLQIDGGILSSGSYSYSLYVDGKLVATKSMIVSK